MLGATAQATTWDEGSVADHTPTLAPAPEGLSARRVEHWLDLPAGAWQGRRLYALRLRGEAFFSLGLRRGDLVVVEPGAREQPGTLVVTRSSRGASLKRIALPIPSRMPTVLELPLREKPPIHGERVVGTVIGVLRATGTGALRPVRLESPRNPGKRSRMRPVPRPAPESIPSEPFSLDHLHQMRGLWRAWLEATMQSSSRPPVSCAIERWDRLDASLATLCDCLARTHSPALRAALAAEAGAVLAAIHEEMRG